MSRSDPPLFIPDEIHDLLRWSDWIRAFGATAKFFHRKLPALKTGTQVNLESKNPGNCFNGGEVPGFQIHISGENGFLNS